MITLLERIPLEEFFEKFRAAPLEDAQEEIYVFDKAQIELREVLPREVNLSTFYILRTALARQREIRRALLERHGIDTLRLTECLKILNAKGEEYIMTPPIVEALQEEVVFKSHGAHGDSIAHKNKIRIVVPTALDGHHRLWMANEDEPGKKVSVVYIVGARSWEHPFYAYPNGWEHVKVYAEKDDVPKDRKKLYRRDPPFTRLRNLRVLGFTGKPGDGRK